MLKTFLTTFLSNFTQKYVQFYRILICRCSPNIAPKFCSYALYTTCVFLPDFIRTHIILHFNEISIHSYQRKKLINVHFLYRKLRRDWWKTKLCTACVSPLGRFLSRGWTCPQCGLRVCKNCRSECQSGTWVCVLCDNSGGM